MEKPIWSGLDHKIWKGRSHWPKFQKLLLGLSGGIDSVALLSVFQRLSQAGRFQIIAAYIHHGVGPNENWRTQAQEHCREICRNLGVSFLQGGPPSVELKSEADLREFRYKELRRLQSESQCDFILTAHHADDLLETRFLRLLRGTGPLGLEALTEVEADLWRPFLSINKREISEYVSQNQLRFIEDPSNFYLDPMRNWVRHELFPRIDVRQAGLVQNLGRSLQLLVEALEVEQGPELIEFEPKAFGFERSQYLSLSPSEQRRMLAKVLYQLGLKNYSQGQIEEIQKRLDNPQKVHKFSLGSVLWNVDARQVRVSREV